AWRAAHERAAALTGAADGCRVPGTRRSALLRWIALAPRGAQLRDSGRGPPRRRMGRAGIRAARRGESDALSGGDRRHGAVGSRHRRQSVLHHAFAAAASRRDLHGVRTRGERYARAGPGRPGRPHSQYAPLMRRVALLGWLTLVVPGAARAQCGFFGEKQIQYQSFKWHVLQGEHVDLYYYPEEQE